MKLITLFILLLCLNSFLFGQKTIVYSVFYKTNIHELEQNQKKSIDSLLSKYAFESIDLIGYADTVGNSKSNLLLSQKRVEGIRSHIHKNVSTSKINTTAKGDNHQLKSNNEADLSQQRRVDIKLYLTSIESFESTHEEIKNNIKVEKEVVTKEKEVSPEKKFKDEILKNDRIIVENLLFEPGKTIFLYNKIPNELYYLSYLLDSVQSLKIKIEGHVCCVDDYKLSRDRAKEVYTFLRGMGIDKSRIQYEGFSNKSPLVEEKTIADQQKNRRVEIVITER
jgi:outer membrane protein OmpA-like peptidoglycan-associated protein